MHLNLTGSGDAADKNAAPTLRVGEIVAEKYRLDRLLGMGGMAEVYAATNVQTDKRVALKWVLPTLASSEEGRTRLRREALAAGRIHHQNVVTIFDVVEHQGSLCLVMELLEGETLASRLARGRQLPFIEAIALILPAMRGVAAAHERGVIHRDLKPDNIFICLDANLLVRDCKVLDFGVSKLTEADLSRGADITLAGNLVGTPAYMSPEQVRGTRTFDARVDVYALGVVLYEMLAGHPPFGGDTYSAVMIEVATTDAPSLVSIRRDVPRHIAQVVHRALERDPRLRFQDVQSFIRELEHAAREDLHLPLGTPAEGLITQISWGRPSIDGSGSMSAPRAGAGRPPRWFIAAVATGAIGGLALGGLWRWQHGRAAAPPTSSVVAMPPSIELPRPAPPVSESPRVERVSSDPNVEGPGVVGKTGGAGVDANGANGANVERPARAASAPTRVRRGSADDRAVPAAHGPARRSRAGKLSVDDF